MQFRMKNWALTVIGVVFSVLGICELVAAGITALVLPMEEDLFVLPLVLGIQGVIFTTLGLVFYLPYRGKIKRRKRLMRDGDVYDAEILDVLMNTRIHVNHVRPFVVECRYRDHVGQEYLVKSPNLWPSVRRRGLMSLRRYEVPELRAKVYVNPHNPRDYHVEVEPAAEQAHPGDIMDLR